MHKLKKMALAELEKIEEQGLTTANFETASELVDMVKDLCEIEKVKEELYNMERRDDRYEGNYREGYGNYGGRYEEGNYGRYSERGRGGGGGGRYREGGGSGGGSYRGYDDDFYYCLEDINEGADRYQENRGGRGRYGAEDKKLDGLEKMMRGIAALVETTMDLAENQEEKEIVKKHIQKIKNM